MRRYLFLLAYESSDWDDASEEVRQEYYRAHDAFSAHVAQHGRELGSAALADPGQATTVRRRAGELQVTEGPFAETVEMIGGYYDVELPDLDSAISAAALLPESYSVEIRPTIAIT